MALELPPRGQTAGALPQARGLPAANIRRLDDQWGMADELFGGSAASQMTFGEAIVCGVLKPPIYVALAPISTRASLTGCKTGPAGAIYRIPRQPEALCGGWDLDEKMTVCPTEHLSEQGFG